MTNRRLKYGADKMDHVFDYLVRQSADSRSLAIVHNIFQGLFFGYLHRRTFVDRLIDRCQGW